MNKAIAGVRQTASIKTRSLSVRIMGIDLGTKNIGIAVSDESATIAQGRGVVRREGREKTLANIKRLIDEYKVELVVVGLPINMDGSSGYKAEESKRFAADLEEYSSLPVELWDERLSTREAEDVMIAADVSRAKRKKVIDKMAAQIILQSYLDSLNREKGRP